jgi:hypothetical protein
LNREEIIVEKARVPVVVATTTFSKTYDLRARLAVKLAKACTEHDYPVVVVDGGSDPEFLNDLRDGEAIIYHEAPPGGMGPGRRQAMAMAGEFTQALFGLAGLVFWTEPEKYTIVPEIQKIYEELMLSGADIAIPDRGSLSTYPRAQQIAENLGNKVFREMTNHALDMWSGPRLVNLAALQYFMEYEGEYGDKWDAIFVPVIRAIAGGLEVVSVLIDYVHPPEQTLAEDTVEMAVKRIIQLDNLLPAIIEETKLI